MSNIRNFAQRIGTVHIPVADKVSVQTVDQPTLTAITTPTPGPITPIPLPLFKSCVTNLKEGCYTITFVPPGISIFGPRYAGTLRVEHLTATDIRFSGDLYSAPLIIETLPGLLLPLDRQDRIRLTNEQAPDIAQADAPGVIPIRPRKKYYSYLKGTGATLTTITLKNLPCTFSLNFDEFKYNQPPTGFSGTFPTSPTRSVTFQMQYTTTADSYTGKLMQGSTELGSLTMTWVSSFFRRANVMIYRLSPSAALPPASVAASSGVGTEDFHSVFSTAGWDLSVAFNGDIPLPASLAGVQDPAQCWAPANDATLMSSIPGYNAADLDTSWRAYLMAVPSKLGCGRGMMFDTGSGNPDNVPREGAVTLSDDGYPTGDSSHFGAVANKKQRDVPRAFLRSASHEIGHTFNQIHQELEGGADNSIMTTTPSVADFLASVGQSFPKDIKLAFNARVRRHLIHLPDPAVRPGAMDFFGAAVLSLEADQMLWPDGLTLTVQADQTRVALGEALGLSWTLENKGEVSLPVPTHLNIESLVARVSVTDPDGQITFLRPAEQQACPRNRLRELKPGESATGSTDVFWGRDGFTFKRPGRHLIEVITMWQVAAMWVASKADTEVWISFPSTENDDRVAALMLHPDVGRAVAAGSWAPTSRSLERLQEAEQISKDHPALVRLRKRGMAKRLNLAE